MQGYVPAQDGAFAESGRCFGELPPGHHDSTGPSGGLSLRSRRGGSKVVALLPSG